MNLSESYLACLMKDPGRYSETQVEEKALDADLRPLYNEILLRIVEGIPVDWHSLCVDLHKEKWWPGTLRVSEMGRHVVSPVLAKHYGKQLNKLYQRKRLLGWHAEVKSVIEKTDPADAISEIESNLVNILNTKYINSYLPLDKATENWESKDREVNYILTGVKTLDDNWYLDNGGLHIVAARPGVGKEQPIDTKILTPHGWVEMGTIKVGQKVIGSNGKPTKVLGVFPQGKKQAYKITFRDKTTTECGIDHLWNVASSDGRNRKEFVTKSLKEIMQAGIRRNKKNRTGARWRIPLVSPIQFKESKKDIDPYIIGVLLGDGCCVGSDIRFSNPDMDSDIRQIVKQRLPLGCGLREYRPKKGCPYYVIIGEKRKFFKETIKKIGLNVLSKNKEIPSEYKNLSIESRKDLLRGLMDTDGSSIGNRTNFFSTSKKLAYDVADLVRSLGGLSVIRKYNRLKENKSIEYVVSVKLNFCPFYTQRKKNTWKPQNPSKYIFKVEKSRIVEQVCIKVEAEDGLYVTNDYIVTHNSSFVVWLASQFMKYDLRIFFASAEMTTENILNKLYGVFTEGKESRLEYAKQNYRKSQLFISDKPGMTVEDIALMSRSIERGGKLQCIIVDYLQFLRTSSKHQSREREVAYIATSLKELAKRMNCPVIACAQLNRDSKDRDGNRPTLAQLRESGGIEQDADSVCMLYRPEYYLRQRGEEVPPDQVGKTEFIISKQRNRSVANLGVIFEKHTGLWQLWREI